MYLLHIVNARSDDDGMVMVFHDYSDLEHYVMRLDLSDICILDCYECSDCVDLLKCRKEKK